MDTCRLGNFIPGDVGLETRLPYSTDIDDKCLLAPATDLFSDKGMLGAFCIESPKNGDGGHK